MKKLLAATLLLTLTASPLLAAERATALSTAIVHQELKDGTKIDLVGNDVYVVSSDGTKTPAPDGTHLFRDGSAVTVKNGKKISK